MAGTFLLSSTSWHKYSIFPPPVYFLGSGRDKVHMVPLLSVAVPREYCAMLGTCSACPSFFESEKRANVWKAQKPPHRFQWLPSNSRSKVAFLVWPCSIVYLLVVEGEAFQGGSRSKATKWGGGRRLTESLLWIVSCLWKLNVICVRRSDFMIFICDGSRENVDQERGGERWYVCNRERERTWVT